MYSTGLKKIRLATVLYACPFSAVQLNEKAQVAEILETYYESDKLKSEYSERTDIDLINHFKNGVLFRYKSDDIVLRTTELQTILDNIRKEVIWE